MVNTPSNSDLEAESQVFRFGEFALDDRRAALYRNGVEIALRPKCFEILRLFVMRAGRLVTKDELLAEVWGGVVVTEGSVTQCVAEIRRALGDTQQALIRTVPRRGFVFQPPVTDAPPDVTDGSPRVRERWIPAFAALLVLGVAAWWALGHRDGGRSDPVSSVPTSAARNTIAVLRFADLSPAGDQGYLAEGIAEEILSLLAKSPELRVSARGSSFAFAPGEIDTPTLARELGVAYILEGSVRREDDDLRITSRLVDATTGFQVWSEIYERKFDRVLQMQQEVAMDVGAALKVVLSPLQRDWTPAQAQSHDLFLLGRHLFHRRRPGDLEVAELHLQQAVALDSTNAAAWAALAGVYAVRGIDEFADPYYRLEYRRQALDHAIEIDPSLAEAHVRLAQYFVATGDYAAASASLARAFELAPNDALVLQFRSNWAAANGRLEDAIEWRKRSVAAHPLSAVYRSNLGQSLLAAGNLEEGLEQLYRARELGIGGQCSTDIATALLILGRREEARREMAALEEGPERDVLIVLIGLEPESQAALDRLQADSSAWGRLRLAEIAAFQGDPDTAFAHLDAIVARLSEIGRMQPEFRVWHKLYSSALVGILRSDPRWPALVERVRQAVSFAGLTETADDRTSTALRAAPPSAISFVGIVGRTMATEARGTTTFPSGAVTCAG